MPRYVWSPHYRVDIGPHVFPTAKYDLLRERLIEEDGARPEDFLEPEPAAPEDVLRVHTREYFGKCRDGHLTVHDILLLELPWSQSLFDASIRSVRGSIMAGRLALDHGAGLHLGGGFHHAFPDHGEGFCVFNDHACAIRHLQADGAIERAVVVDCDLHHGNGTAAIFAGDATVATLSMHQQDLYPLHKPPSTVDIGLPSGIGDDAYLEKLAEALPPLLDEQRPDLLFYVAGADPYRDDQLGSLGLTIGGLSRRDEMVVGSCKGRRLPLAVVLAGGYARRLEHTIAIHLATLRHAAELWRD